MTGYTPRELCARAQEHWDHWAEHLGLANWRVRITTARLAERAMTVSWTPGYGRAELVVGLGLPREYEEPWYGQHVLHEMLHLALVEVADLALRELGSGRDSVLWQLYRQAEECSVDRLTSIVWRLHEADGCRKVD